MSLNFVSSSRILVLGGTGLVGSSIVRNLKKHGFENVNAPTSKELDLTQQTQTLNFFRDYKPEFVFNSAAKVGGIVANNTYRADFIFKNLQIQNNVFEAAFESKVTKMIFMGSSCIYPKNAPQPLLEDYLLSSELEKTNEPYAIAKIAGLKTAESFLQQYGCAYYSLMPTNLYGENDNFDPVNSHVIPGLIRRMHTAKLNGEAEFKIWGTGRPLREFLYVDDLAEAAFFVMKQENLKHSFYNVGYGSDVPISELAEKIKKVVGFSGSLNFDSTKPDGTMRKLMNSDRLHKMGWKPRIDLDQGLRLTYDFYLKKYAGN